MKKISASNLTVLHTAQINFHAVDVNKYRYKQTPIGLLIFPGYRSCLQWAVWSTVNSVLTAEEQYVSEISQLKVNKLTAKTKSANSKVGNGSESISRQILNGIIQSKKLLTMCVLKKHAGLNKNKICNCFLKYPLHDNLVGY